MKYVVNTIIIVCIVFTIASCEKETVPKVEFEVTTDKVSYRVAEPVTFNFAGDPEVISVYSGEPGFEYIYKNRTFKEGGSFNFSFQIRPENAAVLSALTAGSLKVLVSTKFTAAFSSPVVTSRDSALVNATTWTDISNRFPAIDNSWPINTFFPSTTTEANLTDLVTNPNEPFYFAFKYAAPTTAIFGTNGLTIASLNLNSTYPDGTSSIFNVAPGGAISTTWKAVNATASPNTWTTSTTQLKLTTSVANAQYAEQWIVSNAFYPKSATPDKAIPVKNITTPNITKYNYRFSKIGTYKVVFIASNNRVTAQDATTKELTITITP